MAPWEEYRMKAINRALVPARDVLTERKAASPCIFLLHHAAARKATQIIGDYITQNAQVDIYLDLSRAMDTLDDPFLQVLEEGFAWSSHTMIISPSDSSGNEYLTAIFEHMQNTSRPSSFLILKDHHYFTVPSSLEILGGIKSLNEYLMRVSPENNTIIFNNPGYKGLLAHTAPRHPLDDYLNWND